MKKMIFILLVWQSMTAFAQFSDNFNDGLFTSGAGTNREVNWNGDIAEFIVNDARQLQLNSLEFKSPAYLSTASTRLLNTSWEFFVKMNFNPTEGNYANIYLTSDTENLNAADGLNGLFIQIGYTEKNICLRRSQKGKNNQTLVKGTVNRLNLNPVSVHVKATLNDSGTFSLYSRLEGESAFTLEGTTTLAVADLPASQWFGIVCTFTTTRKQHFFFDDFVVQELGEDHPDPDPNLCQENDLIINEILFNPPTGGEEYVELYNRSEKTIDLRSISLATRKTDGSLQYIHPITTEETLLLPENYVLITKNRTAVCQLFQCRDEALCVEPASIAALNNTGGCLVVLNNTNSEIIDQFYFSESLHSQGVSPKKGVALERISFENPTNEASNWASASSLSGNGTPGYRNSQSATTGITKVNKNVIQVEYPKQKGESYLIKYQLDKAGYNCRLFIYDSLGRKAQTLSHNDLLGHEGFIPWNGTGAGNRRLPAGVYIIYLEIFDMEGQVQQFKLPVVVQ
ncbi:MAG: hypothetical protein EZS26_001836 [Candidatus Ordinivivax streblomastigis]|uniref:LTD domain-containing protein n=1 Tax=Candidatus Ordinivivax streblomastigis TaxID=2540710 RepID=A0A5M8P123_9BACT|nr:MAG: hypothetical protein EZS26_001836 [Candidatus Ordinivivax streblomastigis]